MKISGIEELHDKLFDVLCIIDDICKKEGVRYFLDSGTAIGAVREKDFIPWDDDMDIKVLADDYPAFKAAMEKNLPPHMHIVEPQDFAPAFYDFAVRIYDERYTIRKDTEEERYYGGLQNHLGTDVFIYFRVPSRPMEQKMLKLKTKILYGLGMAHRYQQKMEKYTFFQKLQVTVLSTLGKAIPAKTICEMWWKEMLRWQGKDVNMLFTGNYILKELTFFPLGQYQKTIDGEIRGRRLPLPIGIDHELTVMYGDYMKPPKDKGAYVKHLE